jgi:hypothetical protein
LAHEQWEFFWLPELLFYFRSNKYNQKCIYILFMWFSAWVGRWGVREETEGKVC